MENKRFKKNDDGFICKNCGFAVLPLGYSSRNHCPRCLCSLHVDVNPGDRANECGGILRPFRVETDPRKGYIILHKCDRCGEVHGWTPYDRSGALCIISASADASWRNAASCLRSKRFITPYPGGNANEK